MRACLKHGPRMVQGKPFSEVWAFDSGFYPSAHEALGCVFVGTLAYAAPEILLGEQCSLKSDIYSFGVVLWEARLSLPCT